MDEKSATRQLELELVAPRCIRVNSTRSRFYDQVEFPACLRNITAEVAGSRPVVPAIKLKKTKTLWQVAKS